MGGRGSCPLNNFQNLDLDIAFENAIYDTRSKCQSILYKTSKINQIQFQVQVQFYFIINAVSYNITE